MLHFGTKVEGIHPQIWGARTIETSDQDPENELNDSLRLQSALPLWTKGQYLGGIGFYRSESGKPLSRVAIGDYTFNTYSTTYAYKSGQYSFAILTIISLTDGMTIGDALSSAKVAGLNLTDGATLSDAIAVKKVVLLSLVDGATLGDALSSKVQMTVELTDGMTLADLIDMNSPLLSYVVSLFNFALVKYYNFNFNSYAQMNGVYYGINDDGIYQLDGNDDNGVEIDASITLGKYDFDSEMLKQLPAVYIGTKTDGNLILKIVTDSGAVNYYTMTAQNSGDLKTNRITPGKGLKSRYWQFEITNVGGADLTFESISFHPLELKRRIGGAV